MVDVAHMYDKAALHLAQNDWAWRAATQTVYMALYTGSYSPSQAADETYSGISGELTSANGYQQGGVKMTLNDPVVTGADPSAYTKLYSSDVSWAAASFTGVQTIVIYNNVGSKYLIGFIEYGTAKSAGGGTFTVQCPATGWFDLATP
jgi:hypothetical protein